MGNDERFDRRDAKGIAQYEERMKSTFNALSSDLTRTLHDVHSSYVIDPDNEDSGFFDDFTRVIDDAQLKHADDEYYRDVEVTSDPYVGMEMAMSRGAEGEVVHATGPETRKTTTVCLRVLLITTLIKYPEVRRVQYVDGYVEELTANLIAENLIAQVDEEGRRQMMLSAIVDHRVLRDAIPRVRGHTQTRKG
jgi:hypothetical protein